MPDGLLPLELRVQVKHAVGFFQIGLHAPLCRKQALSENFSHPELSFVLAGAVASGAAVELPRVDEELASGYVHADRCRATRHGIFGLQLLHSRCGRSRRGRPDALGGC